MKKTPKKKIDTIEKLAVLVEKNISTTEKLAQIVAEGFSDMEERFEKVDRRFENLGLEVRSGFTETKKILDRHDTRISAVENIVLGGSSKQNVRV